MAGLLRYRALKNKTSLATPLATVTAVAANLDSATDYVLQFETLIFHLQKLIMQVTTIFSA